MKKGTFYASLFLFKRRIRFSFHIHILKPVYQAREEFVEPYGKFANWGKDNLPFPFVNPFYKAFGNSFCTHHLAFIPWGLTLCRSVCSKCGKSDI